MGTFDTAEENPYNARDMEQLKHFSIMQGLLCPNAPTTAQSGRPGMPGDFHQAQLMSILTSIQRTLASKTVPLGISLLEDHFTRMVLNDFAAACIGWAEVDNLEKISIFREK